MFYDLNYYALHGIALRVSDTNPTQLQNIPCSVVVIQNEVGNGNVYVGGIGDAAADADKDFVIYAGGNHPFPIKNANLLTVIGDNDGDKIRYHVYRNTTTEPTINYTVPPLVDTVAPTVSSVTPVNAAVNQERNVQIVIDFSEEINPDTINSTNFAITGTSVPSFNRFIDPSDSSKMIAQPVTDFAAMTVYTITVSGITDLAGNTMVGSSVTTFTTKAAAPPADTTPPTITSKTPDSGAINIERSADIVIVFSETINSSDVNNTLFTLIKTSNSAIQVCSVTLGGDSRTVTMNPTSDLE